jgi:hypothetical protein
MVMAMERKGLHSGHILALAGALAALVALWRPWYSVATPQQLRDMFGAGGQIGSDPGLLGQLSRGMASALPSSISASGWRELEGADIAVVIGVVLVVALVLGAAGALGSGVRVDPGGAGSAISVVGAGLVLIAVVHLVHKPGGAAAGDYVKVADGLWIALAGGAATLAGGAWAAAGGASGATSSAWTPRGGSAPSSAYPPLTPELPPVFAPTTAGATGSSVPPPRS